MNLSELPFHQVFLELFHYFLRCHHLWFSQGFCILLYIQFTLKQRADTIFKNGNCLTAVFLCNNERRDHADCMGTNRSNE